MAYIRKLDLAKVCDDIRLFLDNVGDYKDGEFDHKTEEMLETMQSAWEESREVCRNLK